MTNDLFKVGSLVYHRGHPIDLCEMGPPLGGLLDKLNLHQARAAQPPSGAQPAQLKLGTPGVLGPADPWELHTQPELEEYPLTKRQLKHRRNKDSKLAKEFKSLEADIDNMKYQMDALKDKIINASESASARFKRKKIRHMKREANN